MYSVGVSGRHGSPRLPWDQALHQAFILAPFAGLLMTSVLGLRRPSAEKPVPFVISPGAGRLLILVSVMVVSPVAILGFAIMWATGDFEAGSGFLTLLLFYAIILRYGSLFATQPQQDENEVGAAVSSQEATIGNT